MMRLIDVDAYCETYCRWYRNGECNYGFACAMQLAPTIEAEPVKHGKVVIVTDRWNVMHQECSVCGNRIEWGRYPHYCHNCGATMDLEGEKSC